MISSVIPTRTKDKDYKHCHLQFNSSSSVMIVFRSVKICVRKSKP